MHKVDFGSGSHIECSQILFRISRFLFGLKSVYVLHVEHQTTHASLQTIVGVQVALFPSTALMTGRHLRVVHERLGASLVPAPFGPLEFNFGLVVPLVGQVVRVGVHGGDVLDSVPKFGGLQPQQTLFNFLLKHATRILLVLDFLHSRRVQSLIPKGGILH